jgi:uncharacterized membrane protein YdjX (TVP38/TMEM64 family)
MADSGRLVHDQGDEPVAGTDAPGTRARRALFLAGVLAIGALVLLSRPLHERSVALFAAAEGTIREHPVAGIAVFLVLTAVSAMVAFLSSAILIPVAVYAWGPWWCFVLLWLGWFLGGVAAYWVGRGLGLGVVRRLVGRAALDRFDLSGRSGTALAPVLLLQLALPSDVAGYVFGMLRCPPRAYLAALALAEVPYAAGAVLLGQSFLDRDLLPMLATGIAGVALSVWAARRVARAQRRQPLPEDREGLRP